MLNVLQTGRASSHPQIAENISRIEESIQKTCDSSGRNRSEITLMAVTKFCPIEKIKEAYNCGIRCFGESRVKEAAEKFSCFKECFKEAELHFIGSLQRNKVKQAVQLFDCIQSVDRNGLIDELTKFLFLMKNSDEAENSSKLPGENLPGVQVLFELKTGEDSKSGYATLDDLFRAVEYLLCNESPHTAQTECLQYSGLIPLGLMTMAPFTNDEKLIRASFRTLVKARDELKKRFPLNEKGKNWDVLSMGMSNDFSIAIEEGSTLLRIGSSIFKD